MLIQAKQKYIRISPRKIRLVVDSIRGQKIEEALDHLLFTRKAAAVYVAKTIKQAVANAVNNLNVDKQELQIKNIVVEEGPTFKRWQAVSRGRAHPILKRTSHLSVLLESSGEKKEIKPEKMIRKQVKKA